MKLKELADFGKLQPDDMVWKEGMQQWIRASSLDGLFSSLKIMESPLPPPPAVIAAPMAKVFSARVRILPWYPILADILGVLLLFCGLYGVMYFVTMDSADKLVEHMEAMRKQGGGEKVHSTGLTQDHLIGVIVSLPTAVLGLALLVWGVMYKRITRRE